MDKDVKIKYKIDIMKALKEKGYSANQMRVKRILSESTMQKFRNGDTTITLQSLATICKLLECELTDIVEIIE